MLNYKLISVDLDGTLLNSDMHVSKPNQQAMQKLKDMGVFVVPNSGRSFGEMPEELKNDPSVRFYISSDGADIFDKYQNEHIFLGMDRKTFEKVYAILSDYETFLMLHTNGNSYVDQKLFDKDSMKKYNLDEYFTKHTLTNCVPFEDFNGLIKTARNVELLVAFFKNLPDREECWKRVEALGMHVSPTLYSNIEVSAPTAGKGNALLRLAEHLSVPIEQVMAVGDNYNDLDMLSKAGYSVAVANANQEVKQKTHLTVCSNDEHVIQYLLLNVIKDVNN